MNVAPLDNTETGVARCTVLPSPICPFELKPQHFIDPFKRSAHPCCIPLATVDTPLVRPETFVGVFVGLKDALVPSWRLLLRPQHFAPPLTTAHAYSSPTETEVALVRPVSIGDGFGFRVPSPSCPKLFAPAHCTAPDTMKHVEFVPAATAVTSEIPISTGTVLDTVSPEPNCPLAFEPQHCTVASSINAHAKSFPAATDETPDVRPET